MAFGDYPREYNPKVHGPYDPARYYGKLFSAFLVFCFNLKSVLYRSYSYPADIPFGEVKVGEITKWLSRRDKNPRAVAAGCSRAWWRWNHKYILPKRAGIAPLIHLLAGSMLFFYVINYGNIKLHRNYKYH